MQEKIKAVVIDDVAFCRGYIADLLRERGYQVETFADAETFLANCAAAGRCQADEPCVDLLLTDNQMPGLNGLELIEKQKGKGCRMPAGQLAVISGSLSEIEIRKAEALGCRYFEKPAMEGLGTWLDRFEVSLLSRRII